MKMSKTKTTKQELLDKIKELQAKVDEMPDDKCGVWKPSFDELYWFVDGDGDVYWRCWDDGEFDNARLAIGNVFRTKEEAETHVTNLKIHTRLKSMGGEYSGECCVSIFSDDEGILSILPELRRHGGVYFPDSPATNKAIDTITKEFGGEALINYLKS